MTNRFGLFVVAASCVAVVSGVAAARGAEPCCTVTNVDLRTRLVTVVDNTTKCTYQFTAKSARDIEGVKAGVAIALDVKQLVDRAEPASLGARPAEPASKPAEPVNGKSRQPETKKPAEPASKGLSATASAACGSNVGRNAKTKTLCKVMTGPNSWEYKPC